MAGHPAINQTAGGLVDVVQLFLFFPLFFLLYCVWYSLSRSTFILRHAVRIAIFSLLIGEKNEAVSFESGAARSDNSARAKMFFFFVERSLCWVGTPRNWDILLRSDPYLDRLHFRWRHTLAISILSLYILMVFFFPGSFSASPNKEDANLSVWCQWR